MSEENQKRIEHTEAKTLKEEVINGLKFGNDFKENDGKPFVLAGDVFTQLPCGSENFEISSLYYSSKTMYFWLWK